MMHEFSLIQFQIAFLELPNLIEQDRLFYRINEKIGKKFVEPPTILPIPQMPSLPLGAEIPIVQARNTSTGISMNIGRARIDLFKSVSNAFIETDFKYIIEIADGVIGMISSSPGKIGIVGQYILRTDNPQPIIREIIGKSHADYTEAQLRIGIEFKRDKNKGVRFFNIQQAEIAEVTEKYTAVNVMMDTNYVPAKSSKSDIIESIKSIANDYKSFDVQEAFR